MTKRRKLFRTSSETNRSENPGYSYFSSIAEDISDKQQESGDNIATDSHNSKVDGKNDDSRIDTRAQLTIDIKK